MAPSEPTLALTLEEYAIKERDERYCAVECLEGLLVDWEIDGLALVSTGSFYQADYRLPGEDWKSTEVNVFLPADGDDNECDCVPEPMRGVHRVRGRIFSTAPDRVTIGDATVELITAEE